MNTTLNKIKDAHPCTDGWRKLLQYLNKTEADDQPLELMTVLESNGIQDAVWCLRCLPYLDTCLFRADVAESVLPLFEKEYPDDLRPRAAIEAVREYKAGKISKADLEDAWEAALAALAASEAAAAAYASYSQWENVESIFRARYKTKRRLTHAR